VKAAKNGKGDSNAQCYGVKKKRGVKSRIARIQRGGAESKSNTPSCQRFCRTDKKSEVKNVQSNLSQHNKKRERALKGLRGEGRLGWEEGLLRGDACGCASSLTREERSTTQANLPDMSTGGTGRENPHALQSLEGGRRRKKGGGGDWNLILMQTAEKQEEKGAYNNFQYQEGERRCKEYLESERRGKMGT